MCAESAHLSTFGAETETEAEIRSTSNDDCGMASADADGFVELSRVGVGSVVCMDYGHEVIPEPSRTLVVPVYHS